MQLQPFRYLSVDKRGISTRVRLCQSSEVCGRVAHGYQVLTIDAIDISSTAVAAKVSDGTGEVGRTFVFVDLNLSKTPTVAHGYQALTIDAIDISSTAVSTIMFSMSLGTSLIRVAITRWDRRTICR